MNDRDREACLTAMRVPLGGYQTLQRLCRTLLGNLPGDRLRRG